MKKNIDIKKAIQQTSTITSEYLEPLSAKSCTSRTPDEKSSEKTKKQCKIVLSVVVFEGNISTY